MAGALAFLTCRASPAFGHALRQRYDLPIPLGLYVAGAGATVALSFVVIALFTRKSPWRGGYPSVNLLRFRIFRILVHPGVLFVCRVVSVGLFALIVLAGIFGRQNPFKNIAPTAVWVVWWVGLAYISALLGDLWALINPWNVLFGWAERLSRRLKRGGRLSLDVPYPEWLGVWPAVALFLVFAWVELVWERAEVPASLASAIVAYSGIVWSGMLVFGRERWLRSGELFSVFFATLARFAPTEFRSGNPHRWTLRPYGMGLLAAEPIHFSEMVFVVLMLSTVTFDGFIETPVWTRIVDGLLSAPALYPLLSVLHKAVGNLLPVIHTVALVAFPLLFLAVYMAFVWLMGLVVRAPGGPGNRHFSPTDLARLFVLTLVPIAIAYHLAHYLAYFLVAGQFIVPLASDPFGFGWDLLGTSLYRIDIGVVDARFVWYTAVIAIVTGHIISVCLAHLTALGVFEDSRLATKSQYPMLALMVCYTMISLWILAQPVVETGNR
ncbi:MAG: hypothetical protein ACREP8_11825 [Candidatus Binatia bacterium]